MGTRHLQRGVPCQDYGDFVTCEHSIIGAVADGAGSAKYSDIGSQLAVKTVLSNLERWLSSQSSLEREVIETQAQAIFESALDAAVLALDQEAQAGGYALRDLGCTLLTFIATPTWIAAMQIGDGFIVAKMSETEPYQLLFQPEKGEYINETVFVTSEHALDAMQVAVKSGEQPLVCAATDGLEKVAIRFHDWQPHPPFFAPFMSCLQTMDDPAERQVYLETFLNSDRLNAKTDDDKTLLMCLCEQGQ
ncbi:PP2C family serine/threonine-protein phosphatase [Acaryochloris thomasi]|nr:PP2C family serine/threonine-protein phosphatase [Acaryochloris thomasi]